MSKISQKNKRFASRYMSLIQQYHIKQYIQMGNVDHSQQNSNPHPEQQSKNPKVLNHKYVLQIRDRQIILDYKNKIKLMIGDVLSFPSGGFQGLHLWDANIILARYIIINKQQFTGKSVIELLSGTGIASIAMKKYANVGKIAATDRSVEVTSNITKNCEKNGIHSGMIVACISWLEYINYKAKFDYVIGADLLYKGCPVDVLQNALEKLLNVGGKALIISPQRDNNQDCASQFVSKLDYSIFSFKKQKLHDEMFMESPLLNQVVGFEQFKLISQGLFYLYTLQKIKQKQQNKDKTQVKQKDKKEPIPIKIPESAEEKQIQSRKVQQKNTQEFQIKQQRLQAVCQEQKTEHLKKQLQVVTIKKKQDVPEYERKKKKDLTDIIESDDVKSKKQSQNQSKDEVDQAQEIQVVHKQHNLYDQPQKKSQSDRKSIHSLKQSRLSNLSPEQMEEIRMRKKSNPQ